MKDKQDLWWAVFRGDEEEFGRLLKTEEYDVNYTPEKKIPVLHEAVKKNNPQIVELAIQAGSNMEILDHYGRNPLHLAIQRNSLEAATILLENGADIESLNRRGYSPLYIAVQANNLEATKLLIENNADIDFVENKRKYSLLHAACCQAGPDMIDYILSLNPQNPYLDLRDKFEGTPLEIAYDKASDQKKEDKILETFLQKKHLKKHPQIEEFFEKNAHSIYMRRLHQEAQGIRQDIEAEEQQFSQSQYSDNSEEKSVSPSIVSTDSSGRTPPEDNLLNNRQSVSSDEDKTPEQTIRHRKPKSSTATRKTKDGIDYGRLENEGYDNGKNKGSKGSCMVS